MIFDSYIELVLPYIKSIILCDDSSVKAKIQNEISLKAKSETNRICDEAIELLDSYWIKRDTNIEAVADYKRLRAIQQGYIAVIASEQERNSEISKAMKLFEEAYETASKNLSPAHPIAIIIADDFSSLQFFNLISVDKVMLLLLKPTTKVCLNYLDYLTS